VREPGKSGGAIGFALIFLSLFLSRKKVKTVQDKEKNMLADRRFEFSSVTD